MTLNGCSRIKEEDGDYLILADYGPEGLSVACQSKDFEGALKAMLYCNISAPLVMVKLVRADVEEL